MIALLISFTLFTFGCLYTWIRWGIQKSLSITFYEHSNKLLWWLWMLSFSIPILFVASHGLIFLSVVGIIMIGTAPNYRNKSEKSLEGTVHNAGAIITIVSSFTYLGFVQEQWMIVSLMATFFIFAKIFKLNNSTNWVEVVAFYLTLLGLSGILDNVLFF